MCDKHSGHKKQTYDRGVKSEKIAAWWLRLKGYKILEQRYKTKVGEVDLIARKGNLVIFVEVKARPTVTQALESITPTMQNRIGRAAQYYMSQNDLTAFDLRFDLITITPFLFSRIFSEMQAGRFFIHHLDNAWQTRA